MRAFATIAAVLAIASARATAQPYAVPATTVTWRAPAACGDATELRRRMGGYVEHAVGEQPFAEVEVTRAADGAYHAELRIRTGDGVVERSVEAKDCGQVIDAVALVLAMAAPPPAPSPPGPIAPTTIEAAPPPKPRVPPETEISLRFRGAGDIGLIPGGGLGLDAGVAVRTGHYELSVSARWFPGRVAVLPGSDTGGGIDVGAIAGAGEACRHFGVPLWPCAGVEVDSLSGRLVNLTQSITSGSTSLAITAGVGGSIGLSGTARIVVEVGGYLSVVRTDFVLNGAELYRQGIAGLRGYAGLELDLL